MLLQRGNVCFWQTAVRPKGLGTRPGVMEECVLRSSHIGTDMVFWRELHYGISCQVITKALITKALIDYRFHFQWVGGDSLLQNTDRIQMKSLFTFCCCFVQYYTCAFCCPINAIKCCERQQTDKRAQKIMVKGVLLKFLLVSRPSHFCIR